MNETPHPAADGAEKSEIRFQDLWTEADNQRTRYRIWTDNLGLDPKARPAAIESARRSEIYDAIVRLIERVRADGPIRARLADIAAEEARQAAIAGGDGEDEGRAE